MSAVKRRKTDGDVPMSLKTKKSVPSKSTNTANLDKQAEQSLPESEADEVAVEEAASEPSGEEVAQKSFKDLVGICTLSSIMWLTIGRAWSIRYAMRVQPWATK